MPKPFPSPLTAAQFTGLPFFLAFWGLVHAGALLALFSHSG